MHPLLTQPIDRFVIRAICARQARAPRLEPRRSEALQVLAERDFFGNEVKAPREVAWTSDNDFSFASPVESPWKETQTVHGRLYRCGDNWTRKPTVVLVHGWNDDYGYTYRQWFQARECVKAGMNAAMIELPYHLQRRPRGPSAVNDILSPDLYCSMLAVKQALADLRALIGWLAGQGCGCIGLWGISLGGWFTGLVSSHDPRIRFAVLQIPAVRMGQVLRDAPFCRTIRESNGDSAFDIPGFDLTELRPRIARENLLLIEAEHDLFVSPAAIEDLWHSWGKPEIWRLQHSHLSILLSVSAIRRVVRWIAARAEAIIH